MKPKKGQIWIETVLYTLIGLAIIGTILALVKPAIEEKRDSLVLEQAIEILNGIDYNVNEVIYYGVGNSRTSELVIKKGQLKLDGTNDEIVFSMESKYMYSQPGSKVMIGKIEALTTEKAKKRYAVEFRIKYKNVTINDLDSEKTLQASSTPYKLTITNKGNYVDFSIS